MASAFEDRWTAVGLAAQFEPASCHPSVIGGQEVVVWRGEDGAIQAWEDRCPHRGMRLSFGFVRGNRLTCLYHGWTYEMSGQCSSIPAHPDLEPPKTICTRTFATGSNGGIVYVNMADSPSAALAGTEQTGWYPVRSIVARAGLDRVHALLANETNVFGAAAKPDDAGTCVLDTADGGRLMLAVQPVAEDRTAIHVSSTASDVAARKELSRRLIGMRRELEQ